MRLLVALTEAFRSDGGIPMFNRALVRALGEFCQAYGADVTVLVLNDDPATADPRYLPSSRLRFLGARRRKTVFTAQFLRQLAARPDLVLLGHVNLLPLALAAPWLGCPYWLLAFGIEAWQRLPRVSRRALARASKVLAISDYTRQQLARQNGLWPAHWRLFPCTLDPLFTPAETGLESHPTLLSVSRLEASERAKGIEQVLAVLPDLLQRFPFLRYVVVGEGSERQRLIERARDMGLGETVEFTGHLSVSALAAQYAACSVFVLPSTQEGFGIVFLEAMAHAKPVVAARAGGAPEVVANGETGLLVQPADNQALHTALARLLADAGLRQQMGGAGQRRLEENFVFEKFRQRLNRFLVEAMPEAAYKARRQQLLATCRGAAD